MESQNLVHDRANVTEMKTVRRKNLHSSVLEERPLSLAFFYSFPETFRKCLGILWLPKASFTRPMLSRPQCFITTYYCMPLTNYCFCCSICDYLPNCLHTHHHLTKNVSTMSYCDMIQPHWWPDDQTVYDLRNEKYSVTWYCTTP